MFQLDDECKIFLVATDKHTDRLIAILWSSTYREVEDDNRAARC